MAKGKRPDEYDDYNDTTNKVSLTQKVTWLHAFLVVAAVVFIAWLFNH